MNERSDAPAATATAARAVLLGRVLAAVRADPRVVGMVDYGSSSYGRADAWSDLDLTLFIRDADIAGFAEDWQAWAAQFGRLLLAYIGHIGHPWTVYDTRPLPLRVDFEFQRESEIDAVPDWSNSPISLQAMLLHDASGGGLRAAVQRLVGKSLAPSDPPGTFARLCGDTWYYLLYIYSKLRRGELWSARLIYFNEVLAQLCYLLRLEAGATERWEASNAAFEIERTLTPARLVQLDRCLPASDALTADALLAAMTNAAGLARDVCDGIAARQRATWPRELATRVLETFASG